MIEDNVGLSDKSEKFDYAHPMLYLESVLS